MFFTDDLTNAQAELLQQFEETEVEIGGIPIVQILTHSQDPVYKIKESHPWGIFLSEESAQTVNFKPDDNWKPVTFYSIEGEGFNKAVYEVSDAARRHCEQNNKQIQEHRGFLSTVLMCHVISQSETEIYQKNITNKGTFYNFVGLRYEKRKETAAARLLDNRDEEGRPTHRWTRRLLLMIVDKAGNSLHEGGLQLKAKGGGGGSLLYDLGEFFRQADKAYSVLRGKRRGLNATGQAFLRIGMVFDLMDPGKESAPYLVPTFLSWPIIPSGTGAKVPDITEVGRGRKNERTLKLVNRPLTSMIVSRESDEGKAVNDLLEEFAGFKEPPSTNDDDSNGVETREIIGAIDQMVDPIFKPDEIEAVFDTGEERLQIIIPSALSQMLDWPRMKLEIDADYNVIQASPLEPEIKHSPISSEATREFASAIPGAGYDEEPEF